jgi:fucose permease
LERAPRIGVLKVLAFFMFAMFAMTTDSVGVIIPQIIKRYSLGMTAGGAFQYATMSGISIAALGLGFLADRWGRKRSIVAGLSLFAASCGLFSVSRDFAVFIALLFVSGLAIGVFKAGALALIGDISRSTREHSATMNMLEGFFGVGAIVGPAIVARLLQAGADWKWLYVIAGGLCAMLIVVAALTRFPRPPARRESGSQRLSETLCLLRDPFAAVFSLALMLYVAAEAAVYVWGPTYLQGYHGPFAWFALYVVSIFFVLRAAGRFVGAWLMARLAWRQVVAVCSAGVFVCFLISCLGGRGAASVALPASGLFMSVLYPTINSKGISGFARPRHGEIAGLLLFFTCLSAVLSPLAMAALSDALGDPKYSLVLACCFAGVLACLSIWNAVANPTRQRLERRDDEDYLDEAATAAGIAGG